MKEIITKYPKEIGLGLLSILILIIGSFTIGFLISFIIVVVIDVLYFWKEILNLIDKIKNKNKKSIKGRKNIKTTKNGKSIALSKNTKVIRTKNSNLKGKNINSKNTKTTSNKKETTKEHQTKRKTKRILKKVLIGIIIFFFIIFLLLIVAGILFCYYIVDNAPEFNPNTLYKMEPSIIYDIHGNEIDKLGSEKRINIEYNEIPEVLVNAIVATEDSRFFQHNGVDLKRFLKASFQQALGASDAGGASTITMQLSKKNYTNDNASGLEGIIRKFTDVYVSVFKIEPAYTKEDILTFYVNSNFLGGGYGVEQTALSYFGKSAKDLNVAEAAMIAGLFQAPGKYNPYTNPEGTEKRRQTVLKLMLRHGYITKDEYNIAKEMTVKKLISQSNGTPTERVTEYQSFVDQVVKEVKDKTGKDPYTTSMKIYTTMDPNVQLYITRLMNGDYYSWQNDVVKAGVAVINVHDGSVVALGGGRNITTRNSLNYATQIERQIGSTAKPLYDYAPAIEYLNWSTYNILVDEPITYGDGTPISNWDGGYEGFETMRLALTHSRNIPALKAFKENSKANIIKFVTSLGLSPEIENGTLHEAHAIGGYNGESPMSMAAAYAAFGSGGYYSSPYTFTKIEYADGTTYDNVPQRTRVMSEETAYMITNMLIDTGQFAFGPYSNVNNQQYAGKSGTTNYDSRFLAAKGLENSGIINDIWAVGYNPDYAIGVWYGYDEWNDEYHTYFNSYENARLFQAVALGLFTSGKTFTQPESVIPVTLEYGCPEPCLPSAYTPGHMLTTELFIKGTEPSTVSDRFDKLESVTNLKASASGNTVTLTWNAVKTPKAMDAAALKEAYAKTEKFWTGYLDGYVNHIIGQNQGMFGQFGYYVYEQTTTGLNQIGFTTNSSYTISNQGGSKTYVVKTAYSNFPANMADGKSVSIQLAHIVTPKEKLIKQLYNGCIGRSATNDEIEKMSAYTSASSIAYYICNSDEAKGKYTSADTAIPSWYKGILGRANTSSELTKGKELYTSSRENALKAIINSSEFASYCKNNDLLHTEI